MCEVMGGRGMYSLSMHSGTSTSVELHSAQATHSPVTVEKRKITEYLLKKRDTDDKSGFFIGVLGYSRDNPDALAADLINGFPTAKFIEDKLGYNGKTKSVFEMELGVKVKMATTTVWETADGVDFRFVTAYPKRG